MLVRGKYIILTIAFLSIGAAAFAWWYNVQQSRRSVELWGRPTAEILRSASEADLLRLSNDIPVSAGVPATVKIGDQVFYIAERKSVSDPGIPRVLIEDAAFDWEKKSKPVIPRDAGQLLGLEFHGESSTLTILVDLESGSVFDVNRGAAAVLTEECVKRFRDLERDQFAPARQRP